MARNGAGVYSNPYPNFVNGTVISSDQADANNAAIGTALTQSIAVDGQTTITANLPMNSKKFTGLAVGTAATDSLTLGQAQAQAFAWGGTAGGGADAITISPTPAITAYAVGQKFFWIASGSANTGAATIAISGLTAIAMQDGGAALAAGVHAAGKVFMGVLNTASTCAIMQVQSSGDPLTISALTVNGTSQFSGAIIQGVNGTGYDATFFGDTPGAYLMWDQSADKLLTAGGALVDIVKDKLMIGGTAVTTTAAELNFNDTATAGTVVASKTVVASADKDIASFRNITLTGELDAGSLDISGIADIAGTTTVVALTASGVVTANANIDLNGTELILDADADTSITADTDDTIDIRIAGADDFQFTANTLTCVSGSTLATNTISETTAASGVTIDGLLIKDSKIELADGTAALPSLSNSGDVNSGVAFLAADTVSVTTGGVEQFRFGSNPVTSKNLIINGAMTVAQRGTLTGQGGTTNTYTACDRWKLREEGPGTARVTTSQDALSAANAVLTKGSRYALKADCTTAESSVAAGEALLICQSLEAQNLQMLDQGAASAKSFALSFAVSSPKSGTHCVALLQGDANRYYIAEYTVASADTFEHFKIIIPGDTSGQINNDTGEGMRITFPLTVGTNMHGSAGAWSNGEKYSTSNQQNLMDNVSNNFFVTSVQIEEGAVCTDFAHEDISTTLAKCQRYFNRLVDGDQQALPNPMQYSADSGMASYSYPVAMRATPSLSVGDMSVYLIDLVGSSVAPTAISVVYGNTNSTWINVTWSAAGSDGDALRWYTNGSSAIMDFIAEI